MADSDFLVAQVGSLIIALIIDPGGWTPSSPGILANHKAAKSIIKAIIRISRRGHHEPRVHNAVPCLASLIIALIIDSGGRTPRSLEILANQKAAGVYYQSDYQNNQFNTQVQS